MSLLINIFFIIILVTIIVPLLIIVWTVAIIAARDIWRAFHDE